ncbi:MAG: hypothetical protein M3014_11220 [Chloroflexota bacterium]|nr:hypothetical protein [Chloroflexota bacterium]
MFSKADVVSTAAAFAAVFVLFAGFAPRLPTVAPREQRSTATATPLSLPPSSKIGLHTRLTDEPDPAKIRLEFHVLREMGGSYATEFFPWVYIQPTDRYRYDWTHADLVADAARAEGITILARLDGVPAWARKPDSTWKYIDPEHYIDYADFVYAFVAHFRGRISHYIIWNEPNTAAEWGGRKPDPPAYAALLQATYKRVKEADPSSQVLLAGLAPNLESEQSNVALNDLVYLDKLYEAGAGQYFDGVAVHSYGLKSSPDDPPAPGKLNFARAEEIYKTMVRHGDGKKPVYITEGGWNDSPRWVFAVSPSQRVEYTVEAYRKAEENWPWCRAVCLWASRFSKLQYTYFDNYSFLTPDFIPKAVYLEVQKYATSK